MRSIVKFTTKLSLFTLALCLSMSSVFANTLSQVEINSLETGYGIVLKTDEAAQMKKIVSSPDKLTIELKDVSAAEDIDTIYNNVANIDNVTISPASKNDIKIIFKGKDIASSKVSFETVKTNIPASALIPEQSIKLNGPVSSYTPVYNIEDFAAEEASQTANPELNEVLTKMHITRGMLLTVKRYTKAGLKKLNAALHGDINLATVAGIILIAGAFMMKPRRRTNIGSVVPERAIGLSSAQNLEREIDINKNLAGNMNLNRPSMHAAKAGYGMKAYQQSQKNPYMSTNSTTGVSGIARRKPLPSNGAVPVKKQTLKGKPLTSASAPIKTDLPALSQNKMNSPIKPQTPKMRQLNASTPSDLDSMKFLESITKIYENSGRADLAKGLKDNLRKAQMTQV